MEPVLPKKKFSTANVSDIHLGTSAIPNDLIIAGVQTHIIKEQLPEIDILFVNGDVFDRGLRWTDPIIPSIELVVVELLYGCVAHKVKLRVLEGTPSHDRGQNGIFERFIKYLGLEETLDFKYVDKVSVEYIEDFDIHVLYVPDGEVDTDATFMKVKECMLTFGIDKVDIAAMHGTMDYQLPEISNTPKHSAAAYKAIVRNFINIGHIHDAHQHGIIYGNGSFGYYDHGHPKPKGFWRIDVDGDKHIAKFIENTATPLFTTVDCIGLTVEESIVKIKNVIESNVFIYGSSLRILAEKDNLILGQISNLKRTFNNIRWTTKQEGSSSKTMESTKVEELEFIMVEITPYTITPLVNEKMISRGIDANVIQRALLIVENIKQL